MATIEIVPTRSPEWEGDIEELQRLHDQLGGPHHDCKPVTDLYDLGARASTDEAEVSQFQAHLTLRTEQASNFKAEHREPITWYIRRIWNKLRRPGEADSPGKIGVPHPVFVPGERFVENYYWDTLDVVRGLAYEGRWQDITNQADNFAHLIEEYGYIPNGNRKYYFGRSQPPVFSEIVEILAARYDEKTILERYLPALQKEHDFWMRGEDTLQLGPDGQAAEDRRLLLIPDGQGGSFKLNRFYSDITGLRAESICKDRETVVDAMRWRRRNKEDWIVDPTAPEGYRRLTDEELSASITRDIRAACESGWDFSSRWFADKRNLASICTTQIAPVDLNCNMRKLEQMLARAYRVTGNTDQAAAFETRAAARNDAIRKLFWDDKQGFFFDYNVAKRRHTGIWSLAAVYPMDFRVATDEQARRTFDHVEQRFLKRGGLMTTLHKTDEQWDGYNGWGLLHFRATRAAYKYKLGRVERAIRSRFLAANDRGLERDGLLYEKVDVRRVGAKGDEGEYPCQVGFGMTNGSYIALRYGLYTGLPTRGAERWGFDAGLYRRVAALSLSRSRRHLLQNLRDAGRAYPRSFYYPDETFIDD